MNGKPTPRERAEKRVAEEMAKDGLSRRMAVSLVMRAVSRIIADDVADGVEPYVPRVEEFRALRDMEREEWR